MKQYLSVAWYLGYFIPVALIIILLSSVIGLWTAAIAVGYAVTYCTVSIFVCRRRHRTTE